MKLYLAGPMSNHPQFNFPLFDQTADALRAMGYEVQSPAELDDPETRAAALASPDGAPGTGTTNGETWGDFLSRDVKIIGDVVDGVAVMPEWWTSKGARLEAFCAHLTGKPVFSVVDLLRGFEANGDTALENTWVWLGAQGKMTSQYTLDDLREQVTHTVPNEPPLMGEEWIEPIKAVEEDRQRRTDELRAAVDLPPLMDTAESVQADAEQPIERRPESLAQENGEEFTLFGVPLKLDEALEDIQDFYMRRGDAPVALRAIPEDSQGLLHIQSSVEERGSSRPERPRTETRTTDAATGGQKGMKPSRFDLIQPEPLDELARVYGMGAAKYADFNYLKGYDWHKSVRAMQQHVHDWRTGETYDPESELHHLAHAAWHCFTLMMFEWYDLGTDTRRWQPGMEQD